MKGAVTILLCSLGLSAELPAATESFVAPPRWSFDFKGGRFGPELADWKQYYGSDSMREYTVALGYMPMRTLELGTELGRAHAVGQGLLPINGLLGGEVDYTLVPVHIYVIARAVFTPKQWLIPYAGGGWSRAYYKQDIAYQQERTGHADGWNARVGVQLLLNPLDPSSARSLALDYGIDYTYLTLEAQRFRADVNGTELGGYSYLLGLRLEY